MKIWIGALCSYLQRITPPALYMIVNRRTVNLTRAAVLASSVILMLPGAWGHAVTPVEFAHLPAGLTVWQRHKLGIYRVCGPVSKLLYSWPAYMNGIRVDYGMVQIVRSQGNTFARGHLHMFALQPTQ